MHWIGQQIYDEVVRFRNNVYFEASTITTLSDIVFDCSGTFEIQTDSFFLRSPNANDPLVNIINEANDATSGRLRFLNKRGSTAIDSQDNDETGKVEFFAYDDGTPSGERYARIIGTIHDATSGEESGKLSFQVASHDGGDEDGLVLTGGSVDGEVDVEIGRGAASVTAVQGNMTVGTITSGTWNGTAIASAYLDSDTAHLSGTQTLTGAKTFTNTTVFSSTSADRPLVDIKNEGNNANGGSLRFILDKGAAGADNDIPGTIEWMGDDEEQTQVSFGKLYTQVADATDGQEAGVMHLKVAEYDGTLTTGLKLDGDTDADGEIDVTIGSGAASVTTVAGTLTMGSTAAMTNAGLLSVANQTGITGVGTISSGTWQGTAIATSYLKHKTCFELTGYSVADGSNYFYSNIMSGNKAPFLHDVNIGSDGLTADNPAAFLRANGTVMPYAGTLKIWKGWGASNGTPTVDVGIFKYTPTADDATNDSLVLVKNTQFTGAGNDNLKTFSETSFSVAVAAGDILITAIKGSSSSKTAYFTSTLEIEWS